MRGNVFPVRERARVSCVLFVACDDDDEDGDGDDYDDSLNE